MPPSLVEIRYVFLREICRRDDWFLATARPLDPTQIPAAAICKGNYSWNRKFGDYTASPGQEIKISGTGDPGEMVSQLEYRGYGVFKKYGDGLTFDQKTFVRAQPHGQAGTIRYLQECPGVGFATAQSLWNKFQGDAVRILRETPEIATAAVQRFSIEKATAAAEFLKDMQALEDCTIDLIDLLGGHRFPKATAREAVKVWGNRAAEVLNRDPYKIIRFRGCGFLKADAMYCSLGLPQDRLKRQAWCAIHAVSEDRSGSVWLPIESIAAAIRSKVSGVNVNPVKAIKLAVRAGVLKTKRDKDGKVWIAEAGNAKKEEYVARKVALKTKEPADWPSLDSEHFSRLSDHQRTELAKALQSPIGILTGAAGTGKTFVVAALIKAIIAKHGLASVAIATPTGKAGVRSNEALAEYGLPAIACTTHRLLVVQTADDGGFGFLHGESNPLTQKFLIVDERSMYGVSLSASVEAAMKKGAHMLSVGDPNQLPPIECGAVLRDMIHAGIPTGQLTEIHRNAGTIVKACASIRDGLEFQPDEKLAINDSPPRNLQLISADRSNIQEKLLGVVRKIRDSYSHVFNPIWDVQVCVATNEKGDVSRKKLNELLQQELNPAGERCKNSPFRVNDKVIVTKNGFLSLDDNGDFNAPAADDEAESDTNERGQVLVCNGEFGRVTKVEEKRTIVQFKNPMRRVVIPRGPQDSGGSDGESMGNGCDMDLGYAVTVHKCVHPETLVETNRGIHPIRKIQCAGTIATHLGPQQFQSPVYFPDEPCREMWTRNGTRLIVTNDHLCETWDGQRYSLKPASEVKAGDWVRRKLGVTVEPCHQVVLPAKPDVDARTQEFRIPTEMSDDLAEFLGLMVADGTLRKNRIALGKRHHEVTRRFIDLSERLFGVTGVPFETLGMLKVELCSSGLYQWLTDIGGMNPHQKDVPDCIMESPSRFHAAFLRGLFEDGGVNTKRGRVDHVFFNTVYWRLEQKVRLMLARLGIISGCNSQKRSNGHIYIYSGEAKKFGEAIGFVSKDKQDRLDNLPAFGKQTECQRYKIPCPSRFDSRGHMSRKHAKEFLESEWTERREFAADALQYDHCQITEINETRGPAMCVTVPMVGQFLQNGLPWGNCQGSSAPVIIVALDESQAANGRYGVCDRAWLYTAISRAEKVCFLVGKLSTARQMTKFNYISRRKTFLVELIDDYLNAIVPANELNGGLRKVQAAMEMGRSIPLEIVGFGNAVDFDEMSTAAAYPAPVSMAALHQHDGSLLFHNGSDGRFRKNYATLMTNGDLLWHPGCPAGVRAGLECLDKYPMDVLHQSARDVGRKTGVCCFCNRPLTSPDSKFNGFGPDCARRHGMPYVTARDSGRSYGTDGTNSLLELESNHDEYESQPLAEPA